MTIPEETATLEPAAPLVSADGDAWYAERLAEVAGYDKKMATQCMAALVEGSDLATAELEVTESLFFLATGHSKLADKRKLDAVELGRRLAHQLEEEGWPDRAIAILERLAERNPDSRTIERELAGVMRRSGQVQQLVDRYLDRSRGLLKRGRPLEAIPWLQEVLLVDRSRRDVARLIRDLRYQDVESTARSKNRRRLAILALVFVGLLSLVGMREAELYRRYVALSTEYPEDLPTARERLLEFENFGASNPVWLGALKVRGDLGDLRAKVRTLEEQEIAASARQREEIEQRRLEADRARSLGTAAADTGDLEGALKHLTRALELGEPDWADREQTERDVLAIREWLEGSE